MIIYKATNIINKKIYIGLTTTNLNHRKNQHNFDARVFRDDTPFGRAIRKYGKNNFLWEIIDTAESLDNLRKREIHWIKFFKSTNSQLGYNISDGGETNNHLQVKIFQYDLEGIFMSEHDGISNAGRKTQIDYQNILRAIRNKKTAGGFMWKKTKVQPTQNELYAANTRLGTKGEVFQYDIGGIFVNTYRSTADAAKQNNLQQGKISMCCLGKRKTTGNYQWRYKNSMFKLRNFTIEPVKQTPYGF